MKRLLLPAAGTLFWLSASAQSPVDNCAKARDPVRCEARQAALEVCSGKRGAAKQACLDAAMPPVDCGMASNPPKCDCRTEGQGSLQGQNGKELKKCMHDEQPRKKPEPEKTRATS